MSKVLQPTNEVIAELWDEYNVAVSSIYNKQEVLDLAVSLTVMCLFAMKEETLSRLYAEGTISYPDMEKMAYDWLKKYIDKTCEIC